MQSVSIGLYRHFKGRYFYVTGKSVYEGSTIVTDNIKVESVECVEYFDITNPGLRFTRPVYDFCGENDTYELRDSGLCPVGQLIKDRDDNVTGQKCRFERVYNLNFQLGSVSTEQLIEELRKRDDSPLNDLDIEGFRDKIVCCDYSVGTLYDDGIQRGVDTKCGFFTEEAARNYMKMHTVPGKKPLGVYKRTYTKVV